MAGRRLNLSGGGDGIRFSTAFEHGLLDDAAQAHEGSEDGGFAEVAVRAEFHGAHSIARRIRRGEHHHRGAIEGWVRPNPGENFSAAEAGQVKIEDEDVRALACPIFSHNLESIFSIAGQTQLVGRGIAVQRPSYKEDVTIVIFN